MIVGTIFLAGMLVGSLVMWGVVHGVQKSIPLPSANDPAHRALARHVHMHGTINLAQAAHLLEVAPLIALAHLDRMVAWGQLHQHGTGVRVFYTQPSTARPFLFQPRAYATNMNMEQPNTEPEVEVVKEPERPLGFDLDEILENAQKKDEIIAQVSKAFQGLVGEKFRGAEIVDLKGGEAFVDVAIKEGDIIETKRIRVNILPGLQG